LKELANAPSSPLSPPKRFAEVQASLGWTFSFEQGERATKQRNCWTWNTNSTDKCNQMAGSTIGRLTGQKTTGVHGQPSEHIAWKCRVIMKNTDYWYKHVQ
jgi:hypothetical protein